MDDCSGEPADSPDRVDNLALDQFYICDGIWNFPYALVRSYATTNNCSDAEYWNDHAYVTDTCLVTQNDSVTQRSGKLVCDEVDGIRLELYQGLVCEDGNATLLNRTTYLEGNGTCSHFDDANRMLIECVNRDNATKPEWVTRSPTPEPTSGGGGKDNDDEETWMIVGIVVICMLVIAAVIGIVVYCQSKDKKHYSATSTSEMGGYHE